MMSLIVIAAAVLPTFLILRYFYARDLNPEPREALNGTFWRGVAIAIPAVVLELLVERLFPHNASAVLLAALSAFIMAALVEESLKLWVLLGFSTRLKAFNEPMDGVIYGVTVGLGFATIENLGYALNGLTTTLFRAFSAVPSHAAWGAILGYFVGQAVLGQRPRSYIWRGWLMAFLLHGLYDFGPMLLGATATQNDPNLEATAGLSVISTVVILIVGIVWANRLVRKLNREQIALRQNLPAAVQSAGAEDRV